MAWVRTRFRPLESGLNADETTLTITYVWHVYFNDRQNLLTDGRAAAANAPGIPQPYDACAEYPGALAISKDASPEFLWRAPGDAKGIVYKVTVVFSTVQKEPFKNPLDSPVKWSFSFGKYTVPLERDAVTGFPLINSAGFPFLELPEVDQSRPILTATRNEASFNHILAGSCADRLNLSSAFGYPAKTVKVSNISADDAEMEFEGSTFNYYTVSYSFEVNYFDFGWSPPILDQGFQAWQEKDSQTDWLIHIEDEAGNNVATPQLLNGNGYLASPGNHFFLPYDRYALLDFSIFNL